MIGKGDIVSNRKLADPIRIDLIYQTYTIPVTLLLSLSSNIAHSTGEQWQVSGRRFAERVVTISQESRHRVSPISTLKPSGKADLGRYRRPCWADINYSKWNSYEQTQLLQQLFNVISSSKAMSLHSRCCSDYREELMWQQS